MAEADSNRRMLILIASLPHKQVGKLLHMVRMAFARAHVSRDEAGDIMFFRSRHCMSDTRLQELDAEDGQETAPAYAAAAVHATWVLRRFEGLWKESIADPDAWRLGYRARAAEELGAMEAYLHESVFRIASGYHSLVSGLYPECGHPEARVTGADPNAPGLSFADFKCALVRQRAEGGLPSEPSFWWQQPRRRCEVVDLLVSERFSSVDALVAASLVTAFDLTDNLKHSYSHFLKEINEAAVKVVEAGQALLLPDTELVDAAVGKVVVMVSQFANNTSWRLAQQAWTIHGQPVISAQQRCLHDYIAYTTLAVLETAVVADKGPSLRELLQCQLIKALGCGEAGPTCWPGPQILSVCVGGGSTDAEHLALNPGLAGERAEMDRVAAAYGAWLARTTVAKGRVPTTELLDSTSTCLSTCHNGASSVDDGASLHTRASLRCVNNQRMTLVSTSDIQRFLKCNGFYFGALDGVYGIRTRMAVIGFQNLEVLPTTGAVDEGTAEAMRSFRNIQPADCEAAVAVAAFPCPENSRARLTSVQDVQIWLKCNGFMVTADVTGYMNTFTSRAIRSFQQAACLAVDGVVGPLTSARMREWYDGWHDKENCVKWTVTQLGDKTDSYQCFPTGGYGVNSHIDVRPMKVFLRCSGFSYGGEMAGDNGNEQSFRDAVTGFQAAARIPETGNLDSATVAKVATWDAAWADYRPLNSVPQRKAADWFKNGGWGTDISVAPANAVEARTAVAADTNGKTLGEVRKLMLAAASATKNGQLLPGPQVDSGELIAEMQAQIQRLQCLSKCREFDVMPTRALRSLAAFHLLDVDGSRNVLLERLAASARQESADKCPALATSAAATRCCDVGNNCLGMVCHWPMEALGSSAVLRISVGADGVDDASGGHDIVVHVDAAGAVGGLLIPGGSGDHTTTFVVSGARVAGLPANAALSFEASQRGGALALSVRLCPTEHLCTPMSIIFAGIPVGLGDNQPARLPAIVTPAQKVVPLPPDRSDPTQWHWVLDDHESFVKGGSLDAVSFGVAMALLKSEGNAVMDANVQDLSTNLRQTEQTDLDRTEVGRLECRRKQ